MALEMEVLVWERHKKSVAKCSKSYFYFSDRMLQKMYIRSLVVEDITNTVQSPNISKTRTAILRMMENSGVTLPYYSYSNHLTTYYPALVLFEKSNCME